ncbi:MULTISPECIES: ribbon-helix-helix protein, CopG family [unclassified Synechococcus]|nr:MULTISPECIES: ribbon-helix-helix protein, CopG family [unclassified Synechococcus]RZO12191.1 MAG: ribbon-helix-helix protein, CopG family [Synechococcus sp. MED-G135]|tara:strand:- start:864 stop:1013 length:150 start_codon:yes stop_codon:yes gene_type:complete
MDVRDETENTVHLSPELVKVLDQRRREWGATSRGEVVEMLLGWMKKKSA